ncbi:MAG: tryptophan--tRNA ligase [Candidatus Nealsonbacteria bacterium]
MKERVVSGIRATGQLHLGNYLGAMRNFVDMQEKYECFFFIADYHTLTTAPNPETIRQNLPEIVLSYLAIGLDPEKCTIFAQSSVPEITELTLLLSMIQPVSELERLPTYKDKKKNQPKNINLGLLSYPVLMAADIIIQKANLVPVGRDQLPHIELTQKITERFNRRYGDTFPVPKALIEKAITVPGLDGTGKMGKSEVNAIDLIDEPEVVYQKIKVAVTDTNRKRRSDSGNPFECNLYTIHEQLTSDPFHDPLVKSILEGCKTAAIGCVECKERLSARVVELLKPFQERRKELASKLDYVQQVLHEGGLKARKTAQETVAEAREKMGLQLF